VELNLGYYHLNEWMSSGKNVLLPAAFRSVNESQLGNFKQSHFRPGVAQRVPGSQGSQIT